MVVINLDSDCISSKENLERLVKNIVKREDELSIFIVPSLKSIDEELIKISEIIFLRNKSEKSKKIVSSDEAKNRFNQGKEFFEKIFQYHLNFSKDVGIDSFFEEMCSKDINVNEHLYDALTNTDPQQNRFNDYLLSIGPRYAARIVALFLKEHGINAERYDSYKMGIITDSMFGNSRYKAKSFLLLKENLKNIYNDIVPIVTSSLGITEKGEITTGFYRPFDTASLFAVASNCAEIIIYKNHKGKEIGFDLNEFRSIDSIIQDGIIYLKGNLREKIDLIEKKKIKIISIDDPDLFLEFDNE